MTLVFQINKKSIKGLLGSGIMLTSVYTEGQCRHIQGLSEEPRYQNDDKLWHSCLSTHWDCSVKPSLSAKLLKRRWKWAWKFIHVCLLPGDNPRLDTGDNPRLDTGDNPRLDSGGIQSFDGGGGDYENALTV